MNRIEDLDYLIEIINCENSMSCEYSEIQEKYGVNLNCLASDLNILVRELLERDLKRVREINTTLNDSLSDIQNNYKILREEYARLKEKCNE